MTGVLWTKHKSTQGRTLVTRSLPYQIQFCEQCHLKFMYKSVTLFTDLDPEFRKITPWWFPHHRKHKASQLQSPIPNFCYENDRCLSQDATDLNTLRLQNVEVIILILLNFNEEHNTALNKTMFMNDKSRSSPCRGLRKATKTLHSSGSWEELRNTSLRNEYSFLGSQCYLEYSHNDMW